MNIVRRSNLIPSTTFFDDFLTRELFDWSNWTDKSTSIPRTNILETDNDFVVEMAAPGLQKDDFQLELDNDMLTIQVDINDQSVNNNSLHFTRREFSYQSFKRSFYLPNTVEADKIEARYENGILKLLIPKKEEARKKPVKTIPIS